MIADAFFASFFDFLSAFLQNRGYTPVPLMWVVNILFFVFNNSITPLYALYAFIISGVFSKKSYEDRGYQMMATAAMIIPYTVSLAFVFLSPILASTGKINAVIFYIDENGFYYRGTVMFTVLYIITGYYALLSVISIWMNREKFKRNGKLVVLLAFFVVSIVGLAIQTIWPNVLIEWFCVSLAAIVFSYNSQRIEDYVNNETGLYNRKALSVLMKKQFDSREPFDVIALLIDDVDYLSRFFGIKQREDLLKEISDSIKGQFYKQKIFSIVPGRIVICFKDHNEAQLQKNIEQIKTLFTQRWLIGDAEKITLKLYTRICYLVSPQDANSPEELEEIVNFIAEDPKFKQEVIDVSKIDWVVRKRNQKIQDELIKGVRGGNRFQVYYQPIYSVKEGVLIGAEALCRLQDDDGNYISPEEFIPLAERNGTIFKIGQRVLESVCKMISSIRNPADFGIRKIHINLSVCQSMQDIMADTILNYLKTYKIKPSLLSIEITENSFDYLPEIFTRNIKRLGEAGVEVVMDDYGIGYSNLNYLLDMPFKMVKIDRNIVWAATADENHQTALNSTVSMIKQFGMPVLASGIETKEQAVKMSSMGCDYLQGFYFGKPVPEKEFLNMMSLRYRDFNL
ncbi:MAG: GGDEF domain-containing phosphodiesterase [Treponemataceae bacterium]|nr:GGDEF domain-containing phosphodiesterase [Treponemataceae bacterium]